MACLLHYLLDHCTDIKLSSTQYISRENNSDKIYSTEVEEYKITDQDMNHGIVSHIDIHPQVLYNTNTVQISHHIKTAYLQL